MLPRAKRRRRSGAGKRKATEATGELPEMVTEVIHRRLAHFIAKTVSLRTSQHVGSVPPLPAVRLLVARPLTAAIVAPKPPY